ADALGARHMNVGDIGPPEALPSLDQLSERFAALCDRASNHGLLVAIEFLPWTGIPDAATAWDIARRAGRPNGGVLIDCWHYFRGAADEAQLRRIPPAGVIGVQLDDADPERVGEPYEDTVLRRRLPGQGCFDLTGLVRALDEMGVAAPFSVEIIS